MVRSKNFFILIIGLFFLMSLFLSVSAKMEYTPSSETNCINNVCNKVLYSGIRFVEENGKYVPIEEAKSLKDKGFIVKILEDDENFPLEVIDFNYSSIVVKLNPKGISIFDKDVPLRIWKENKIKEEEFDKDVLSGKKISKGIVDYKDKMDKTKEEIISFNLLNQKETKTYDFSLGDILEFGYNSTTIQLQDNETENLGDSYVRNNSAESNYGSYNYFDLQNNLEKIYRSYLLFNLSLVPETATIDDASFNLYAGTGNFGRYVYIHQIYSNSTWNESGITWNNQPCGVDFDEGGSCNLTYESKTYMGSNGWKSFNITKMTSYSYGNSWENISFALTGEYKTISNGFSAYSRQYTSDISLRPYVNITYTLEGECVESIVNSSWSDWNNESCVSDEMNQSRSLTEYDENSCETYENVTYYEFQLVGPTYLNESWSDWNNESCLITDLMNQTRNLTQYDIYSCASNETFIETQQTENCDYCIPSLVNSSWSSWENTSSCSNDYYSQNRSLIQYDEDYENCYLITELESDLIENLTFWDSQNVYCGIIKVCDSFEKVGYTLIKIFSALILLGFVAGFGYFRYNKNGSLSIGDIIIIFIGVVFCLALLPTIFSIIAGECGVY